MSEQPRDLADYEREYAASSFETVQARYRKRLVLELMDRLRPRRVLEVGCGMDTLANHWTAAERFVILEPAANFAQKARQETRGRSDVEVVEAYVEDARLGEQFDLILLSGLLCEVPDPELPLRAVRPYCGPDSTVHVNVANSRSFHRVLALEMGLIASLTELSPLQRKLQQFRTFTQEELRDLASSNGYRIETSGGYFVKPFTHGQMQQLIASQFLTEQMLDGLWGVARHIPDLGSEIYVNLRLEG